MARDIVCGMEVEEDKAAASSEYKGKEYYFCSEYCKKEFDQNPEKYISASERPAESPGPRENWKRLQRKNRKSEPRADRPSHHGYELRQLRRQHPEKLSPPPGVEKASVNFATSRATVMFDPQLVKPQDFISTIRKIGYEVGTVTTEIPIEGIVCASCVQKIEKALLEVRGVAKAVVNLATGKVRVEYLPSETNLGEIKRTIERTGYRVLEVAGEEAGEDIEQIIRRKEYKKLKLRFISGIETPI